MDDEESRIIKQLAIGRLFRICSRPYQPGDDDEYMRVRAIIMGDATYYDPAPNYVRDRMKGP